jgi:hypothetical protein
MTYNTFIENIKTWLSGTTDLVWVKDQLEDEIELPINESGIHCFPAAFIVPLPFTIDAQNRVTFSCRVYLADEVGRSPVLVYSGTTSKRTYVYSELIDIFLKFIQHIPDSVNGIQYPITVTPILLWDSNVDGLYFDINLITTTDCV